MFLSDRDIKHAIKSGTLIVDPSPPDDAYDENSIDLHLGPIEEAMIWNKKKAVESWADSGGRAQDHILDLGQFDYRRFAAKCLAEVPKMNRDEAMKTDTKVYAEGQRVIVRPLGFLLWTTAERVGTPDIKPELVAFVNAKSTKARTGIMVHFTAPTINSGWNGKVTLEIINLGPFDLGLREGDAIAQLTVAKLSSSPDPDLRSRKSQTIGQVDPKGRKDP